MKNINKSIFGLMIIGGLVSCKTDQKERTEVNALKVTVQKAVSVDKVSQYQFSGKVKADDKLILSTKAIGQVEKVYVDKGENVTKGQLLLKIRSKDILSKKASAQASLREAKSVLKNTEKDYQRTQRLYDKGSATQKELDDISTARESDQARVESIGQSIVELDELLSYSNLKAPIDGFVSQKFVNEGTMATPGSPLIALESLDQLKIEISVPEFEIGLFTEGDPVQVEIDAIKEKSLTGSVDRIITSSAFSGSQYQVLIVLKGDSKGMKPGMFARVSLLKNKESKTIVPRKAIVQRGQLSGLYTVNQQGEAMLRWVRLGKEFPEGIEVLSGLKNGEQYIMTSESKLTEGVKVEITKSI
ncbi:MAG: efflux RND transporter periplasmic adaptor subunit [Reichenbachiella sp.]|uniref:efflux RND transporter periplasmic adaptor subunit n=1 Tax=Reichenbachiella sp. TaxID=2184521 RepID=UPI003265F298